MNLISCFQISQNTARAIPWKQKSISCYRLLVKLRALVGYVLFISDETLSDLTRFCFSLEIVRIYFLKLRCRYNDCV
jgi:hypothetical protein